MTWEIEETEWESGKLSLTHPRKRKTAVALILLNCSGHAYLFGMERFYWFEILFVKWMIEMSMAAFNNRWNWLQCPFHLTSSHANSLLQDCSRTEQLSVRYHIMLLFPSNIWIWNVCPKLSWFRNTRFHSRQP